MKSIARAARPGKTSILMASSVRVSILMTVLLLLLFATFYVASPSSSHGVGDGGEMSSGSVRSLLGLQRNNRMPNCGEMASKSQCLQSSKCRWCRSDAIDDMCFSSSEAWRLPPQVFSCD